MAARSAQASSSSPARPNRSGSASKPVANLIIIAITLGIFLKISVVRGWIHWPPGQLAAMLAALAGWVALSGPLILFRHEEQTGPMGLGDRVWITSGLMLWTTLVINLAKGRLPALQNISTAISSAEMASLSFAILFAGLISRPKTTHWTWTNITGWFLALSWLISAVMPSTRPLLPLLALGGN